MKKFFKEFKEFLAQGNALQLAFRHVLVDNNVQRMIAAVTGVAACVHLFRDSVDIFLLFIAAHIPESKQMIFVIVCQNLHCLIFLLKQIKILHIHFVFQTLLLQGG